MRIYTKCGRKCTCKRGYQIIYWDRSLLCERFTELSYGKKHLIPGLERFEDNKFVVGEVLGSDPAR